MDAALDLFYHNGMEAVSIRDIAKAVNISVGNLTYHFPAKTDIIHELCNKLIVDLNKEMNYLDSQNMNSLLRYYLLMKSAFKIQLRYRFLFEKKLAEIVSSIPEVQAYYQNSLKGRFSYREKLHEAFVKEKLAKPILLEETIPLSYSLNIVGIFWHQDVTIYSPELTDTERIDYALALNFQQYKPYLTKKGLEIYAEHIVKLKPYTPSAKCLTAANQPNQVINK